MKLMKIIILLLSVLSLYSCGIPKDYRSKDDKRVNETTDALFVSYVDLFEQAGKAYTGNPNFSVGDVPINFGDTENEMFQGVCFTYPDGKREVIVRKAWWATASSTLRESLIFHELGHCVLGRDHNNETIQVSGNSKKISLMNSVIINSGQYNKHRDGYLTELFTYSKTTLLQSLGL